MLLILLILAAAAVLLYGGLRFYGTIDWDEPPESGPDFRAMRKKEAELLRIQEVLTEAREQGKVSRGFLEELNQFCDREISGLKAIGTAWKQRRKKPTP